MAEPKLSSSAEGRYQVCGDLTFGTVLGLLDSGTEMLDGAGEGPIEVDLGEVGHADSAGLALLIEWMRAARQGGRELSYRNIPTQLMAIARVSDLEEILPLAGQNS